MRRMLLLLTLLLLPAAHAQAQPPSPGARVAQVDTSHYPEVTLYVGVTDANGLVDALIGPLQFPPLELHRLAFDALWKLGPAAKEAVPLLMERAADRAASSRVSRLAAIRALGDIGEPAKRALPSGFDHVVASRTGRPPSRFRRDQDWCRSRGSSRRRRYEACCRISASPTWRSSSRRSRP